MSLGFVMRLRKSYQTRGDDMSLVMISIDRSKLPPHTDEEFEAWVKFEVGEIGSISRANPLANIDIEAEVLELG